jgi:hypothetical protein
MRAKVIERELSVEVRAGLKRGGGRERKRKRDRESR